MQQKGGEGICKVRSEHAKQEGRRSNRTAGGCMQARRNTQSKHAKQCGMSGESSEIPISIGYLLIKQRDSRDIRAFIRKRAITGARTLSIFPI